MYVCIRYLCEPVWTYKNVWYEQTLKIEKSKHRESSSIRVYGQYTRTYMRSCAGIYTNMCESVYKGMV